MKFSSSVVCALAATPFVAAAPAPFREVEKRYVDTNGGFTGAKLPAHFVAREKATAKRQLDLAGLLGGLTGGAGGNAGSGGLASLLDGLTGGGANAAGGAGGLGDLLSGLTGGKANGANAAAGNTGAAAGTGKAGMITLRSLQLSSADKR